MLLVTCDHMRAQAHHRVGVRRVSDFLADSIISREGVCVYADNDSGELPDLSSYSAIDFFRRVDIDDVSNSSVRLLVSACEDIIFKSRPKTTGQGTTKKQKHYCSTFRTTVVD